MNHRHHSRMRERYRSDNFSGCQSSSQQYQQILIGIDVFAVMLDSDLHGQTVLCILCIADEYHH